MPIRLQDGGTTSPTPEQIREALALEDIRSTYNSLDRWRARSREVEEPQSGSELHGDAVVWPDYPPHQVARLSLTAGVQHLNLARVALEQREAFPIAHPTVLRGALLGAARRAWLLAPDDRHARQQNALRTIHEVHRRLRQFIESGAAGLDPAHQPQALAELLARLQAIKARRAPTPSLTAKQAPTETEIVTSAALTTFSSAEQQPGVTALWMQLSGDAYGLGWPTPTRPSTEMVPLGRLAGYPAPMSEVRSGAVLDEIGEAFVAAFTMLQRGWSLFDRRYAGP